MRSREVRWKMEEGRWKREDGIWNLEPLQESRRFSPDTPLLLSHWKSVVFVATARGRIGGATTLVLVLIAALVAVLIASLTSSLSTGRGLG